MEKTKPNATKTRIHQSKKCSTAENNHKKTKARFSRLLQHPAWKRSGSVLKETIRKEKMKKNKCGRMQYKQAKQCIAPKSKIKSRAHYAPEPARGSQTAGKPCKMCC